MSAHNSFKHFWFKELTMGLFKEPEEALSFIVLLTDVRNDARIDEQNAVAKVTVEPSDYIRGLLQFTAESRYLSCSQLTCSSENFSVINVLLQVYWCKILFLFEYGKPLCFDT